MRRSLVLWTVLAMGGVGTWIHAQQGAPASSINPANFTGKVTDHPLTDIRTSHYSFEPGARTNWHSHTGGQVISIRKGRMRVQEQGQGIRELAEGDVLRVAPGVTHWHGALPNEGLTQVSLSFGPTNWMGKVSDAEYTGKTR